jgi:hypothetical protein
MSVNEQVNVVCFTPEFDEFAPPRLAHVCKYFFQSQHHFRSDAFVPVFNCQYDVIVQAVSRVVACV